MSRILIHAFWIAAISYAHICGYVSPDAYVLAIPLSAIAYKVGE